MRKLGGRVHLYGPQAEKNIISSIPWLIIGYREYIEKNSVTWQQKSFCAVEHRKIW